MSSPPFAHSDLRGLVAMWRQDARILNRRSHSRQAKVLRVCADRLEQQANEEGGEAAPALLERWAREARVLDRYGYRSQATALAQCVRHLRVAVPRDG